MTDPNNERHPSTLSDDERAALQASDPSAYDADDAGEGASGDGAGGEGTGGEDTGEGDGTGKGSADKGSAAASEGAGEAASADAKDGEGGAAVEGGTAGKEGGSAEGAAGTPPAVPAARLAEVVAQRNNAERLAAQQAAELARLREQLAATKPPKDFDAEFEAVLKQYDEGEIDQAEFERRKRAIQREEHAHISSVEAMKAQAAGAEAAVERSWEEDVAAWTQANPGFLDKAGNPELFQRALNAASAFHGPNVSNTKLLEEASKLAFAEAGYTPPAKDNGAAAATTVGDPAAGRRAQNAQRAAEAAGAPPAIDGGVGGRGGPERGVDLENLKPGTFSQKLSKAEQEKLLGEGAV